MWYNHKFFKYCTGILLILLIIFMFGKIEYFLKPFKMLVASIFTPLLISGFCYYLLRPFVKLLESIRVRKSLAIAICFIVFAFLIVLLVTYTGAIVVEQFNAFRKEIPNFEIFTENTNNFLNNDWFEFLPIEKLEQKAIELADSITKNFTKYFFGLIATVSNVSTIALMVPFILFYFLKDDEEFARGILSHLPRKYFNWASKIMKDVDKVLSSYIVGQMLVALAIGVMMFIGYKIIGIKYALILSIFTVVTTFIPFFGPFIGIVPAFLVSLTIDPIMTLKVLLVMLIVQQIDNNFISPQIMGQRLNVHPVTVLLLLMIGVSLYGLVGLLLVIPLYAALKVTVKNIYEIYKYEKSHKHA